MKDQLQFLKQWASDPLEIAAIAPSGRALAAIMTENLGAGDGPVIELGPGTGVFTRALIASGIPEENIALIELNPDFAEMLRQRFPKAQVHCMSAGDLTQKSFFESGAGTVISGLGLLSMPDDLVEDILTGTFFHLRPGGRFRQFTYGPKCPVKKKLRKKLGLKKKRLGGTFRNLPPASVYELGKA